MSEEVFRFWCTAYVWDIEADALLLYATQFFWHILDSQLIIFEFEYTIQKEWKSKDEE